jgi:hypothetical protein
MRYHSSVGGGSSEVINSCSRLAVVLLQTIILLNISVPSIVECTYSGILKQTWSLVNSVFGVRAVMKTRGGRVLLERVGV